MMDYSLQDAIKETTVIGAVSILQQEDAFHLTYGSDERYQLGVGISVVSVLINNPGRCFAIHIFTDEYSSDYYKKLQVITEQFSAAIVIYTVDATFFHTLPSTQAWSQAMYYRLLAYQHLYPQTSRVLYLDADVMCAGDISDLVHLDFGRDIAAVVDDLPGTKKRSIERLGKTLANPHHYFNSGVMLVNLTRWHEEDLTCRALKMLLSPQYGAVIKYPDQDVLNILLSNKLIYLERKYNTIYTLKSELKDKTHRAYQSVLTDKTIFVHFTGITKPWHTWADYSSREIFNRAWRASPWRDSALLSATSIAEMQKAYKHLFVRGNYLRGLIALIKYKAKKIL